MSETKISTGKYYNHLVCPKAVSVVINTSSLITYWQNS